MSGVWVMIAVLALATAALKLAGPLALGGRPLSASALSIVELLASALLAALVVVGAAAVTALARLLAG